MKQLPAAAFPQLFSELALFFSESCLALAFASYVQLSLPSHHAIASALCFSVSTLAVAAIVHPPEPVWPLWDSPQPLLAIALSRLSSPVACRSPLAEKL